MAYFVGNREYATKEDESYWKSKYTWAGSIDFRDVAEVLGISKLEASSIVNSLTINNYFDELCGKKYY